MLEEDNDNEKKSFFYAVSLGLELGFLIVVPLVVFLLLGLFLDKKFGTFPILLILFILFSLVSAVMEVRFLIMPFLEKRSQDKNNANNTN